MSDAFSFRLSTTDGAARAGEITTLHGRIATPAFMPVGTQAAMKAVTWRDVRESGAEIVLANTYHLMLRPGAERIAALGGLHAFTQWDGPILTDSGGFQVMSLANLRKVEEDAVTFRSHVDGTPITLSPERAIEIQSLLGSDITMQLDECLALPSSVPDIERAMQLSLRWAERCKRAFDHARGRALFGIVQGGDIPGLRIESARALVDIGFDGYAIGGLAVGEPQHVMLRIVDEVAEHLPADHPRYLMGVGTPEDLLEAVARGMDMFDCVLPTRNGRNAMAFTADGPVRLRNAKHKRDPGPLESGCPCYTCRRFCRAYLHHLFLADEMLGPTLLSLHNVAFYCRLMAKARDAIAAGAFAAFHEECKARWVSREAESSEPSADVAP